MFTLETKDPVLAAYIREQISSGYTALSKLVAPLVEQHAGQLFVIVPEGFKRESVSRWDADPGRIDKVTADAIMASYIKSFLRNEDARVIIQDFERKRSDSTFRQDPRRLVYGEEIYWQLHGLDLSEEILKDCIVDASHWPWIAYFCRDVPSERKALTAGDIARIAGDVAGIAVQALHDSYAVWWRADVADPRFRVPFG